MDRLDAFIRSFEGTMKKSVLILCFCLAAPLLFPVAHAGERGITIRQKLAAQSGATIGNFRALVIGINDYVDERIPDLQTAVGDARSVADILRRSYGFSDVRLLLDRQATDSAIIRALRRLATSSRGNDSVLIYYAGHGDLDRITHDGYWIPANATASDPSTYIENAVIQKYIKAIPARHVLLVADSCFSGALFGTARAMPPIIDEKFYANLYRERSRWGLTSGNLTPVSDGGSGGHSIFAGQLIKALQQNRQPYVTPRQIYQRIAPVISNNSEQMPLAKPIRDTGDEGGEFIFIRSDLSGPAQAAAARQGRPGQAGTIQLELEFWNSIKDSNDPAMFQAYLKKFPNGTFAELARIKSRRNTAGEGGSPTSIDAKPSPKSETGWPYSLPQSGNSDKGDKGMAHLTIEATPSDARIRILNIKPRYKPGIALKPWHYLVAVDKPGYEHYRKWVVLGKTDLVLRVKLPKIHMMHPLGSRSVAGVEMSIIPEGDFMMGRDDGNDDMRPAHRVHISSFLMGKYEVTQSQWKLVMGSNPSRFKDPNRPVEQVSWYDVQEFIRKLNARTGEHFRLPTEAEWEYAARAGRTTFFSWGDELGSNRANCSSCGSRWDDKETAPVGSFQPNTLGLYDMHGNVWEWTQDWFGAYSRSPATNPTGPRSGRKRVARGGGWGSILERLESAFRMDYSPDRRSFDLGFRLARDLNH